MLGGRGDFKQHVQSSHVEEDLWEWRMTWEHQGKREQHEQRSSCRNLAAQRSSEEAAACGDRCDVDRQGKEDSPSHISHWDFSLCWMGEPRSFWKGLAARQHACPHVCPPLTERALHLAPSPGT